LRGISAGNGKSVARAGFGTAYQVFFNGNQGNELVALLQNNINITNPSYPDPFGGRDPITFVSTAPPNVGIMANDLKNAPTTTGSVGFSQQLRADTAINIDGVIQRTSNLPLTTNVNQPITPTGRVRCRVGARSTWSRRSGTTTTRRSRSSGETAVEPLPVPGGVHAVEAGH
jgi:hypothetical protein